MGDRLVKFDDMTLEETTDVEHHVLALDGREVDIDLSAASFRKLQDLLAPYFEKGRRADRARKRAVKEGAEPAPAADEPVIIHGRRIAAPGQRHTPEEVIAFKMWCRDHGVLVRNGQAPVAIWQAFFDDKPEDVPADRRVATAA